MTLFPYISKVITDFLPLFSGTMATASHLTCLKWPHFRHDIMRGCKTCPNELAQKTSKKKKQGRQPAAKLARDWSPLSRILKVPPRQKRFRQTRRSTSPITLPLLPAGDGDDERRKIQAPRGANYHIEICLTLHEDNVGHEVHARKHNDSHTRKSGGPETPRTRNVVPDLRKEGENMCVGNYNNNKKK